jgi:hypothetical protein
VLVVCVYEIDALIIVIVFGSSRDSSGLTGGALNNAGAGAVANPIASIAHSVVKKLHVAAASRAGFGGAFGLAVELAVVACMQHKGPAPHMHQHNCKQNNQCRTLPHTPQLQWQRRRGKGGIYVLQT